MMDYDYGKGKVWAGSKVKEFSFKVKGSPGNGVVSQLANDEVRKFLFMTIETQSRSRYDLDELG